MPHVVLQLNVLVERHGLVVELGAIETLVILEEKEKQRIQLEYFAIEKCFLCVCV